MPDQPRLSFVLGGARSGKSRHAEALARARPAPWTYIATATPGDAEMAARIARHREDRGAGWRTVEEPLDLAAALHTHAAAPEATVLVDCLTLWTGNLMGAGADLDAARADLVAALTASRGRVILVANDVGLGIVPDNALARAFRDAAGRLNQAIAATADHVVFIAAGLPLTLKGAYDS